MRYMLLLVLLTFTLFAADKPPIAEYMGMGVSITEVKLDVVKHKLTWKGTLVKADGKPQKFEAVIDPDKAWMRIGKETQFFSPLEALDLHGRLDTLFHYALESTFWFALKKGSPTPVVLEAVKKEGDSVL